MKFEPENNGGCQIKGCSAIILQSTQFPLCSSHFHQKTSVDNNHCLIKLCENERHEAFSFCEKHCDEFFEKEESELKQKIEQLAEVWLGNKKEKPDHLCHIENCKNQREPCLSFCAKHVIEYINPQHGQCHLKGCFRPQQKGFRWCQEHWKSFKMSKQVDIKKPSPSPLLSDVINSKGLILCSVDTMKKILNGGES